MVYLVFIEIRYHMLWIERHAGFNDIFWETLQGRRFERHLQRFVFACISIPFYIETTVSHRVEQKLPVLLMLSCDFHCMYSAFSIQ